MTESMKQISRKAVSLLTSIAMLFGLVQSAGVFAFAADGDSFDSGVADSGSGTEENPYLISTADQLKNASNNLSASYKLTENITLDSGMPPIGSDTCPYTGTFDGDGHTVTVNMISDANYVGLFGIIGDGSGKGTVQNLKVAGSVTANGTGASLISNPPGLWVGGLVGYSNHSNITNCSAAVTVKMETEPFYAYIGGLVGKIEYGDITNCSAAGNVTGTSGSEAYIGGLVGLNKYDAIQNCFASGNVTGGAGSGPVIGGLSGFNSRGSSIKNSYATGNVTGSITNTTTYAGCADVGGLVGDNASDIENCYAVGHVTGNTPTADTVGKGAYVGGFVAYNRSYWADSHATVTNCYASCDAEGTSASGFVRVGGFVGISYDTITNCYASGSATGSSGAATDSNKTTLIGGFAGNNNSTITNCYASGAAIGSGTAPTSIGGFAGRVGSSGTVSTSYYDTQTTGWADGVGLNLNTAAGSFNAEGLTTAQMTGTTEQGNIADFSTASEWVTTANTANYWYYPQLQAFRDSSDSNIQAASLNSVKANLTITKFADLADNVKTRNVATGTVDLKLPASLSATVNGTESFPITNVTWAADPFYEPTTAGTYTFTAVLPSPNNYKFNSGVNLPKITVNVVMATDKAITEFKIGTNDGVINQANHTIAVTVPYGTNVTALTPTILVSANASVSPSSEAAQDFTTPVTYTVTAEDGGTQEYIVTVIVAAKSGSNGHDGDDGHSSAKSTQSLPSVLTDKATGITSDLSGAMFPPSVTKVFLSVTPEISSGTQQGVPNGTADLQGKAAYNLALHDAALDIIGTPYLYNISLLDQSGNPISFTGSITVKIPLPARLHGTPQVFRYESNGTLTDLGATVENGFLVFKTDHFSYYLVAGTGDSITLDTKSYEMPIDGKYQIGVKLTGSKAAAVKVYSTNKAATVTKLTNGNYQVTGENPGTVYIMYDVYDNKNNLLTHASVRVDVKAGVKPNGNAARQYGVY